MGSGARGGKRRRFLLTIALWLLCIWGLAEGAQATVPYRSYVRDRFQGLTAVQYAYLPETTRGGIGAGCGALKEPTDLFLDQRGNLYIADAGNGRVVIWSAKDLRHAWTLGDTEGPGKLVKPVGIFVLPGDGRIFVADEERKQIVIFSPDGKFLYALGEPRSKLLDAYKKEGYQFRPSKIVVDRWGYLYMTNAGEYRGMMKMTPQGAFVGFFGATSSHVTWWDRFYRRWFMSRTLAQKMVLQRPEAFNNMCLADDGRIFTVNPTAQGTIPAVRRLSPVGKDTLPTKMPIGEGRFGMIFNAVSNISVIDVAVDVNGIFTLLDQATKKLFQYEPQGNMISVFGGRADEEGGYGGIQQGYMQHGLFYVPVSVVADKQGGIYVLDAKTGSVTKFRRTAFGDLVHQAVRLYNEGRYEEAAIPWRQVAQLDSSFYLAYDQIGKAYFRAGRYKESMQNYLLAQDQRGYSKAFREYRQQWLRQGFSLVASTTVIILIWLGIALSRRRSRLRRRFKEGYHA